VPIRKVSPVNTLATPGAVNPFIRFSVAGLNGSCGANNGASTAARIRVIVTKALIIATGDRRNDQPTSLSQAIASRDRARAFSTG
jgi:hypothetical protein